MERGSEEGRNRLRELHRAHLKAVRVFKGRPEMITVVREGWWHVTDGAVQRNVRESTCPFHPQVSEVVYVDIIYMQSWCCPELVGRTSRVLPSQQENPQRYALISATESEGNQQVETNAEPSCPHDEEEPFQHDIGQEGDTETEVHPNSILDPNKELVQRFDSKAASNEKAKHTKKPVFPKYARKKLSVCSICFRVQPPGDETPID
ncbi:hypothetical protein Aduo_015680 [Ancylostoma duodenale]